MPTLLDSENAPSAAGFRPKRGEFATYWKRGRIQREVDAHLGKCWFIEEHGRLKGYLTLLADRLDVKK